MTHPKLEGPSYAPFILQNRSFQDPCFDFGKLEKYSPLHCVCLHSSLLPTHLKEQKCTGCPKKSATFLFLSILVMDLSNKLSFLYLIEHCYAIMSGLILGLYDDNNQRYSQFFYMQSTIKDNIYNSISYPTNI